MSREQQTNIRELARILVKAGQDRQTSNSATSSVTMTMGTIISIETTTCTVDIMNAGVEASDIHWFIDAYTPVVGDAVWMLRNGASDLIILGRTS